MKISADRGKLTDGRIYKLDDDQGILLEKVHQDHAQAATTKSGQVKGTKNIVLYGHAGTGEQKDFHYIIKVLYSFKVVQVKIRHIQVIVFM